MNNALRHRVIVTAEPPLLAASLAAWLVKKDDLDVVVDPSGDIAAAASARDVILSSQWLASAAPLVVMQPETDRISIFTGCRSRREPYQGLAQLYSLIKDPSNPARPGNETPSEGGAAHDKTPDHS